MIEELVAFNPEINVDRIRALGMVMLYREEKMILFGGNMEKAKDNKRKNYLGKDKFFENNWKKISKFKKDKNKSPLNIN